MVLYITLVILSTSSQCKYNCIVINHKIFVIRSLSSYVRIPTKPCHIVLIEKIWETEKSGEKVIYHALIYSIHTCMCASP